MTIHISVLTRFHSFELANAFAERGHRVILSTGYPRWWVAKHVDPSIELDTYPILGTSAKLLSKVAPNTARLLEFFFIDTFDRLVSRKKHSGVNAFLGWSGCSLHTMKAYAQDDVYTILERGSANIRWEQQNVPGVRTPEPVMAKEEAEYQLANAIHVPSNFAKSTFPEPLQNKTTAIALGIDTDFYQVLPSDADPERPLTFCFIGMLNRRKGADLLFEAFQKVRQSLQIELIVIGTEDGLTIPKACPGIRYLGTQSKSAVRDVLNAVDCLILPSRADGWGMVVTEALACGVPVICSDCAGAADLVNKRPLFGSVVSAGSIESIASAMFASKRISMDERRVRSQALKEITSWAHCVAHKLDAMPLNGPQAIRNL